LTIIKYIDIICKLLNINFILDFNPFNDYIIASGSEDTKVMIWNIPENGLTESISKPVLSLEG